MLVDWPCIVYTFIDSGPCKHVYEYRGMCVRVQVRVRERMRVCVCMFTDL